MGLMYYVFMGMKFSIILLIGLFYVPSLLYIYGSILCIAPPILHKMFPHIICSVIRTIMGPFYVRHLLWSLIRVHKWSLYIYSFIQTIYVHILLWGLTPVHKIVQRTNACMDPVVDDDYTIIN